MLPIQAFPNEPTPLPTIVVYATLCACMSALPLASVEAGPAASFSTFLELAKDPMSHEPDEFFSVLDGFLANPERHREHVRFIVGFANAVQTYKLFTRTGWPIAPLMTWTA